MSMSHFSRERQSFTRTKKLWPVESVLRALERTLTARRSFTTGRRRGSLNRPLAAMEIISATHMRAAKTRLPWTLPESHRNRAHVSEYDAAIERSGWSRYGCSHDPIAFTRACWIVSPQCRWGPVTRPVAPTLPISAATRHRLSRLHINFR